MRHTLIPMSAREVLAAIHRGKNALVNVEGPHGRIAIEDGEEKRQWKALASGTTEEVFASKTLAPFLTGEQVYFSLSSIYRAPWHKYTSTVTGLTCYSRDDLEYLNCACTDIDIAHDDGAAFDFDAQAQEVLDFTLTAGLPYPSLMSDSGRGMWLFWPLKDRLNQGQPVGAWRNLQVFHSRLLGAAVAAYRKYHSGTDSSCTDSQRVARFPGSINAKSGTPARYFRTSDQIFTMPELADAFGVKARKTIISLNESTATECTGKPDCKCGGQRYDDSGRPKKPVCLTQRAQAGLARWRTPLSGLRALGKIRGHFSKGQRNTAVYLFAAIGKRAKLARLQSDAIHFAGHHCPGLKLSEIQKCVKAARKNWKHISNAKIIEMLKITDAEREQLAFWLKPATQTKEAEITFRRSILEAEMVLHPVSIRKAVFVLAQTWSPVQPFTDCSRSEVHQGFQTGGRSNAARLIASLSNPTQKTRIPKILLVCRWTDFRGPRRYYRYKQKKWDTSPEDSMNGIEDYSPFQAGAGRFANMVRIALGEERGYIEMHVYGVADVYKPSDEMGEYSFRFTPADGPMLRALADELESRQQEYADHLSEQAAEPEDQELRELSELESEPPATAVSAPAKKPNGAPQIVAGPAAKSGLNEFALK